MRRGTNIKMFWSLKQPWNSGLNNIISNTNGMGTKPEDLEELLPIDIVGYAMMKKQPCSLLCGGGNT